MVITIFKSCNTIIVIPFNVLVLFIESFKNTIQYDTY